MLFICLTPGDKEKIVLMEDPNVVIICGELTARKEQFKMVSETSRIQSLKDDK